MDALTNRQKQVYDFIRGHIDRRGYPPTLQEIAGHLEVSGNLGVLRHLSALEKKGYILRHAGSSRGITLRTPAAATMSLPVVGTIRAGLPQLAVEDIESYLTLDASLVKASDAFILRVSGDSMIDAHICPGDLAIIRPQATADNRDIVAAILDGEATLKRFFREHGHIRLQPENSAMAPIIVSPGHQALTIVGKLIGIYRELD